jgi:hypothetical protein
MMGYFNGMERTATQLRDLLEQAGWKLVAIHHDSLSAGGYQKVIAAPN